VALGDDRERAACAQLLRAVVRGEATTRALLARVTSWSPSTVSRRVGLLLDAGLLVERGQGSSSGGRPAVELALNPDVGVLLSAQVGPERFAVSVSDFAGGRLGAREVDVMIEAPERALTDVHAALEALLAEVGRDAGDVIGIALGLPCPVDDRTARVVRPPRMPGWDGFDFRAFFAERFDAPLLIENDANMKALGEAHARGAADGHLLFVEVGTGLGSGIVSHGRLHRGADGSAGEIGHLTLPGKEDVDCLCGKSGCVEAVAGGWALVRDLRAEGVQVSGTAELVRLASSGDPRARRAVHDAANHIGEVLAGVVSFYNPTMVIVGGEFSELQEELLAGIRSVVYRRALPIATKSVAIEASIAGADAGAIGATVLLQDHVLTGDGLRHALGSPTGAGAAG
jgi:predicted NBD/HSP70 family sugar kinase